MSKVKTNDIVTNNNVTTVNDNFQKLEDELNQKVLYRKNPEGEPNQMHNLLDMNGNRIINLPYPESLLEPVRRIDMLDFGSVDPSDLAEAVTQAEAAAGRAEGAKEDAISAALDAADASRLTIGTVTTVPYTSPASASIVGPAGEQQLNLNIPRGAPGSGGGGGGTGKLNIVVIGDSMSARQSLLDDTWTSSLEDILNNSGANVEVHSLARNGATFYSAMTDATLGSKTQLQKCIDLQPDIVIVALGINDGYRANSVGEAAVIANMNSFFDQLITGLPSATIVYASETFFDRVHGSALNLKNEQTFPLFANMRPSGFLQNTLCPEIMPEFATAAHASATVAWSNLDMAIKSRGINWFEFPIWQAARLGLLQSDGFHLNYEGHRFVASAAFKWCLTQTTRFPTLGSQGSNSWNDWSALFNALLESNGVRYVNKSPGPNDAVAISYWGPWNTAIRERWFSFSKASLTYDIYGTSYVKRQNTWGFKITGALPNAPVSQSANETTWQYLGNTDSRGNFTYSVSLEGLGVVNGNYNHRVKVGNDVFDRFDYSVSGTEYITANNIPLSGLQGGGATTGQVLTWNGFSWAPAAGGGGGGGFTPVYFVAAGATSSVNPVRGSHVPIRVTGTSSSHNTNVVTDGGYWVGAIAPSSGIYIVNFTAWTNEAGYPGRLYGSVTVDGVRYNIGFGYTPVSGDLAGCSFSVTVPASSGQTIQPFLYTPPSSGQTVGVQNTSSDRWFTWSICKIGG